MTPRPRSLTTDEVELVQEIENYDVPPNPARRKLVVQAETVRALVLGLPVEFPSVKAGQPPETRTIGVTLAGLRFLRCIVVGKLNLQDASRPDGTPLPPLMMEECIFTGPVEMSRARFRAISFAGSRITEILGTNLLVEGPLDLSGLRSSEGMAEAAPYRSEGMQRTGCVYKRKRFGRAWVELKNCQIQGPVKASKSCFAAPEPRPGFNYLIESPQFALGLQGCSIRGSLVFNETFAMGGISASLAQISGDVLGSGARLTGIESSALRLDGARIGSSVYLRPWSGAGSRLRRFHARGRVGMRGTQIADSLGMEGAFLKAAPGDSALIADRADVGSYCLLSGYTLPGSSGKEPRYFRFEADGGVDLDYSTIRGELSLTGALLERPDRGFAFLGRGLTVWGDVIFGSEDAETPSGRRSFPFIATAMVNLSYSDLRQDLNMGGAKLYIRRESRSGPAFSGEGMRVKGCCRLNTAVGVRGGKVRPLRFWSSSQVHLTSAEIRDTLFMNGARIQAAAGSEEGISLELFGARIGQEASLTSFQYESDKHHFPVRFDSFGTLSLPYMSTGTALRLNGVRVWRSGPKGAIFGDYVRVGSFISLGPGDGMSAECHGRVDFSHAEVGTDLNISWLQIHVESTSKPALRIVSSKVGGELWLWQTLLAAKGIPNDQSMVNLSFTSVAGKLQVNLSGEEAAGDGQQANKTVDIDLRELHVHQLEDSEGRGWGHGVRLRVDGFVCDRLPQRLTDPKPINILPQSFLEDAPILRGTISYFLKFLAFLVFCALTVVFLLVSPLLFILRPIMGAENSRKVWKFGRQARFGIRRLAGDLLGLKNRATQHIAWLNLHYRDPENPQQEEFTPSAYDALARLLRDEGYETESKKILAEKLTIKRKVSMPWYAVPGWWFFHRFFNYGLSPRPFLVMAVLLLFGWGGVWVADHDLPWLWNHKHVLVVATSTVNTLAVEDPDSGKQLTTAVAYGGKSVGVAGSPPVTTEIPCGKRIDPLLYATELFIPALDLHQTSLCEISYEREARWWRWGRALYTILGWIVTSIAVLTAPGILRKRAEE